MQVKKWSSSFYSSKNTVDAASCRVVHITLVCPRLLMTGAVMPPASSVILYRNSMYILPVLLKQKQGRLRSQVVEQRSLCMNIDRLKEKVVLVTGAGSGLGEATARAFTTAG